jgi:DNA-binding CsgD family transcriptional regulator
MGLSAAEQAVMLGHVKGYVGKDGQFHPWLDKNGKPQADSGWDRALTSLAKEQKSYGDGVQVRRFKEKGMSVKAIAERLHLTEGVVRKHLEPVDKAKALQIQHLAEGFKRQLETEGGYVEVGLGTEHFVGQGVSREKMRAALAQLEIEGYEVFNYQVPNSIGGSTKTTRMVLSPPGTTYKDVVTNSDLVKLPSFVTQDDKGLDLPVIPIRPPVSMDRSRIMVVYEDTPGPFGEKSGSDRDGFMLCRPGVEDLDLGASTYAQVRIKVGDNLYAKGVVARGPEEGFPDGIDLIVYSNKSSATPDKAFKPLGQDPTNPFGATILKQNYYGDPIDDTTPGKQGLLNIVNEEGAWDSWSRSLSSQMLSKQKAPLIRDQTQLALREREAEHAAIMAITNPVVRRQMLESFADDCEGAAVHLKAAAMPRQSTPLFIPVVNIRPDEAYAPSYRNGERLALIRYPHGGTFEIAEVIVNNNNVEGKAIIGSGKDAIGLHYTVAQQLSGADFDGDTGIAIPNDHGRITATPPLSGLKNFDPMVYASPYVRTYKDGGSMNALTNQKQMGSVSNLITDMTIQGADTSEIERAVRHSMVVIDCKKKPLDYLQSERDCRIAELKETYQGGARRGAATLISKASGQVLVDERSLRYTVDANGRKIYAPTGDTYTSSRYRVPTLREDGTPTGRTHWESYKQVTAGLSREAARARVQELRDAGLEEVQTHKRQTRSTNIREARTREDIEALSRGTPVEAIYVDYAASLLALGRQSRLEAQKQPNLVYSPAAAKKYAAQVSSLDAQLVAAEKNSPRERQARALADRIVREKRDANPGMTAEERKKLSGQVITYTRTIVGAKKPKVVFSDEEWEAVQAGAISTHKLRQLMRHADTTELRQRATPKAEPLAVTIANQNRIAAMIASGYTQSEVAEQLGVSVTTVKKYM